VGGVTLLSERECPFTIRTVETCHDDQGGVLRGNNTIHIITGGGVTVAHLGDLGHQLTAEQLAAIGKVDGILIPVGGTYTLDAAGAKQVCDAIAPKWVVPMHYHHGTYGFPVLLEVEDFLNLWPAFTRVEGSELTIDGNTAGVNVLTFA
jgi:L-ascorbate metabolism protein UlaG (beta-lactamase superfamily)